MNAPFCSFKIGILCQVSTPSSNLSRCDRTRIRTENAVEDSLKNRTSSHIASGFPRAQISNIWKKSPNGTQRCFKLCSVVFSIIIFTSPIQTDTTLTMTMGEDDTQQQGTEMHSALTTLQPIRDLAKNWDIDIAAWYVFNVLLVSVWFPPKPRAWTNDGICILYCRVRQK